jgi:hypothetical protein
MNEPRIKSVAEVVMLIIAAYDEELAILRRERDEAKSAARQAAANASHWKSNHADQVARCALLRERLDLPVDRIPAYKELVRLQQAQAQQGEAKAPAPLFDRKLADLERRGYQVIGRILHKDGEYALFDNSCRWLTKPQYQRLMHEQDGSLFAQPAAPAPALSDKPFCYMSETYEVALLTEPPKAGSQYADMFPVYRTRQTTLSVEFVHIITEALAVATTPLNQDRQKIIAAHQALAALAAREAK